MNFYILENIGLDNSYSDTIDFPANTKEESLQIQKRFWENRIIRTFESIRWLGSNKVVLDIDYNLTLNFSYCAYDIEINGSTKRFYAFINDIRMAGNKSVELTLQVDIFQTFLTDFELLDSYIERQHEDRLELNLDRKFNTQPEDFYIGENYKEVLMKNLLPYASQGIESYQRNLFFAVVTSTKDIGGIQKTPAPVSALATIIVPFINVFEYDASSQLYVQPKIFDPTTGKQFPSIRSLLKASEDNTIYAINIVPCIDQGNLYVSDGKLYYRSVGSSITDFNFDNSSYVAIVQNSNTIGCNFIVDKVEEITNQPNKNDSKNMIFESKMFTDPYFFYQLHRINNEPFKIKNEYLDNHSWFDLDFFLFADGIIRESTYVRNYKLTNQIYKGFENKYEVVNVEELPLKSDQWQNYFNNNKSTIQNGALLKAGTAGASILGGLATGSFGISQGVQTAIGTTASIISDQMRYSDIKQAPDTIRSVGNAGSYMLNSGQGHYIISYKTITDEYKEKLFEYFYRFGYKSKKFGIPDIQSRYYFNFIKTIGVKLTGNLNEIISNQIKVAFDRGITYWHYRNEEDFVFKKYEKENCEMIFVGE